MWLDNIYSDVMILLQLIIIILAFLDLRVSYFLMENIKTTTSMGL